MTEEQGTVFAPSTVLGISRVKVGGMVVEGTRAERGTEEEQAVDIAHFFIVVPKFFAHCFLSLSSSTFTVDIGQYVESGLNAPN